MGCHPPDRHSFNFLGLTLICSSLTMKILPFIFLTLHHAFRVASTEKHGRHFSRGALITKANRRLGGHVVASLKSPSLISCGQACLSHSRCFSTNFQIDSPPGKVNCELNDQGVVSWRADSILPKMEGFVFSQYKREKVCGDFCTL